MHKALWGETRPERETRDHGAIFIDVGFHENVHGWNNKYIVSQFQKLEIWTQGVSARSFWRLWEKDLSYSFPLASGDLLAIPWHSLPYRHTTLSLPLSSHGILTVCVSVPKSLLFTWAWSYWKKGCFVLSLHLQLPHFRIRYHSEVLEVRTYI